MFSEGQTSADLCTLYTSGLRQVLWTSFRTPHNTQCMATSLDKSEAAILARALGPEAGRLSPELAEHVLSIGLTASDKQAAQELAELARQGRLTPEQGVELENYRRAGRIFELLKSKARMALGRHRAES
jgi:hypothetical protein